MSAHSGGSRRPRKAAVRRSFRPEFDLLEGRTLPAGVLGVPGSSLSLSLFDLSRLTADVAPPTSTPSGPGVVLSTDQLQVTAGGPAATYTLALATQPAADVTVTLAQFSLAALGDTTYLPAGGSSPTTGDNSLTIDPHHLTFTADNWNTPQTVTVTDPAPSTSATPLPCGDLIWIFGTTSSNDPNYDALAVDPVTVTVNNPVSTGGVTVSKEQLDVNATAGTTDSFTVALTSQPTANVTIQITQFSPLDALRGGSAPGGSSFVLPYPNSSDGPLTVTPTTLTFTPDNWNTAQTVTVADPGGDLGGPVVLLDQTVTSDDPNYNNLLLPPVVVTRDDFQASTAAVVLSTDHLDVARGGDPATFMVALASKPTADVTITLAQTDAPPPYGGLAPVGGPLNPTLVSGSNDPLTITPTTLTFTPDNWDTTQTVTVAPPTTGSGYQFDWISETVTSDDANYNNLAAPFVSVSVTDPNATQAGVLVSEDHLEVARGGEATTFTVALASKPTANVTITIAQGDPTMPPGVGVGANGLPIISPPGSGDPLQISPTSLTFTPDNWDTPQTVKVGAPTTGSGPQIDFLILTAASDDTNYSNLVIPPLGVSVTDPNAEQAGVVVSAQELKVARGGDPATFTVALASKPSATVTITVAQAQPPTASGDVSILPVPGPGDPLQISPTTLTFTPDNWNTPQTVTVGPPTTGSGDQFDLLTLTVASDDTNYNNLTIPPVGVDVADPNAAQAGVTVSEDQLDVARGGDPATFTVALTSKPTAKVTITVAQGDPTKPPGVGGAANGLPTIAPLPGGGDPLQISPTTLTFTPDNWDTPQTVTVGPPTSGSGPQFDILTLTAASDDSNYSNLFIPPIAVSVSDPNAEQAGVVVSAEDLKVARGGDPTTFTVALASKPSANVTITVAQAQTPAPTANGDVSILPLPGPGDPLQISPTTLTFTPDNWNTAQTVTVGPPTTGSGDQFDQLTLTVASDDTNYNNLAIPPVGVYVADPNAALAGVTVSEDHLDLARGGDPATFTVALTSKPTANVTITVAQGDPTMLAGSAVTRPIGSDPLQISPTTLTFTPDNWDTPQTVTVGPPTSGSGPQFDFVTLSVTSDDSNYSNLVIPPVGVSVTDPNAQQAGVVVSAEELKVARGGDSASFTVALASQPTANVTITVAQASGLIRNGMSSSIPLPGGGDPLQISPTTLTFTPDNWNTPQTVTVGPPTTGSGDQFDQITLTPTSDDTNYNNLFISPVSVYVVDPNAAQAAVVVSADQLTVTAGGDPVTYTLALASKPTADVTITITQVSPVLDPTGPAGAVAPPVGSVVPPSGTGNPGPLTLTPTTLTFTPDNWNTPQTVQVSLPAGQTPVPGVVFLLQQVTSDDSNYNNLIAPSVTVRVADNTTANPAGLVVSEDHLEVAPDGTASSFTIALATKPTADVTITIAQGTVNVPEPVTVGPDAPTPMVAAPSDVVPTMPPVVTGGGDTTLTITPTTLTFTPDNWNTPQTVQVAVSPSSGPGFGRVEWLTFTASSDDANYNNLTAPPLAVVLTGDGSPALPPVVTPVLDPLPPPPPPTPQAVQAAFAVVSPPTKPATTHGSIKPAGSTGSTSGTGGGQSAHHLGPTNKTPAHHGHPAKKPHHGKH
jgi:hypothetical protein